MGVAVPRFAGDLSYDGTSGLVLREPRRRRARRQRARSRSTCRPPRPVARCASAAALRDADGEGLAAARVRLGRAAASARPPPATLDVSWPRGRDPPRRAARVAVDLAERAGRALPLAGRLEWKADDGLQTLRARRAAGPGPARPRVERRGGRDSRTRISRSTPTSADLAAGRRARRAAAARARQRRGAARRLHRPRLVPRALAREHRLAGLRAAASPADSSATAASTGAAPVDGRRSTRPRRRSIRTRSCCASPGRSCGGTGGPRSAGSARRTRLAGRGADRRLAGRGPRAASWSGRSWRPVARAARRSSAAGAARPQGEARLTARDGRYDGVALRRARGSTSRWKDHVAELTSAEVSLGGGRVSLRGSLTRRRRLRRQRASCTDVDLGTLAPAPPARIGYGGRLSGDAAAAGHARAARALGASVRSPRLFFGDEGIGALEARLTGTGDGRSQIDGSCRSPRVDVTLAGSVGALPPYEADAAPRGEGDERRPVPARRCSLRCPAALSVVASGEARIRGPARLTAEALRGEAVLPDAAAAAARVHRARQRAGEAQLYVRTARAFAHPPGRRGHGSRACTGRADLVGEGPLAVSLGVAPTCARSRSSRGGCAAAATPGSRSTSRAPAPRRRVAGTLELEGAGLRVRGFPHGVEGAARARALQRERGRARGRERHASRAGASRSRARRLTREGRLTSVRHPPGRPWPRPALPGGHCAA